MLAVYVLWSSLLLSCMGQVVKAQVQIDVPQADGALDNLVEDMQAALQHLEDGHRAMNGELLQYQWPQLGGAVINAVFDEAKNIVTNTSLAAIDALQKHFQRWSTHTESLEESLAECMDHRLCSEIRPWPSYPAQMKPFNVSVSSEGGCCDAITWEYPLDAPLFRINGQLIQGSPKSRGFNIVAVNRISGHIVRMGSFDTHGSAEAADRMVNFIRNGIPDDSIVLAGALDSANGQCPDNSDCVQALREIGGTRTSFGYRSSYALIGFKGGYCGRSSYPNVVSEDYASYPGDGGREGKLTAPVTVHATIDEIICR